jgi:hypothetical protein
MRYAIIWFSLAGLLLPSRCTAVRLPLPDVGFWQILLQKSFWGDERKFLEPLMRFTSGDVRDHIVSSKIDHGPP